MRVHDVGHVFWSPRVTSFAWQNFPLVPGWPSKYFAHTRECSNGLTVRESRHCSHHDGRHRRRAAGIAYERGVSRPFLERCCQALDQGLQALDGDRPDFGSARISELRSLIYYADYFRMTEKRVDGTASRRLRFGRRPRSRSRLRECSRNASLSIQTRVQACVVLQERTDLVPSHFLCHVACPGSGFIMMRASFLDRPGNWMRCSPRRASNRCASPFRRGRIGHALTSPRALSARHHCKGR